MDDSDSAFWPQSSPVPIPGEITCMPFNLDVSYCMQGVEQCSQSGDGIWGIFTMA